MRDEEQCLANYSVFRECWGIRGCGCEKYLALHSVDEGLAGRRRANAVAELEVTLCTNRERSCSSLPEMEQIIKRELWNIRTVLNHVLVVRMLF